MKGTIKSKKEIERLFQSGRRSSSSCMTVLSLDTQGGGRCAFIAGKKLGSAPVRSRCKRLLRAAAHDCGQPWNGYDVVFIAQRNIMYKSYNTVVEQMKQNLNKLGISNGEE